METVKLPSGRKESDILGFLASNSWSVWMETRAAISKRAFCHSSCFQFVKRMNGNWNWLSWAYWYSFPCFQFVKRMNGNFLGNPHRMVLIFLLPIREAYEWKRLGRITRIYLAKKTCFQFVKRMNGNNRKRQPHGDLPTLLASNSWSVWMEIMCRVNSWIDPTIFLIPIN